MKGYSRQQRIAPLIQKELAIIFLQYHQCPEFKQLTITDVQVAPDLATAKIFFSLFDEKKLKEIERLLQREVRALRYLLAQKLNLRRTPLLHFIFDTTGIRAQQISTAIDAAIAADEKLHQQ